jgi:C-terminal processing protease CtpA/Prc
VKERKLIYRHAFKNGPGHNDFEQFNDVYLEPAMDKTRYDKKVVVLTNRLVYSAANYFSAICSVYDITLIGDQTGGGGGAPAGSELPNGFHANYSSSVCLLPNGYNIEDGIPPDIKVDMSDEDRINHIDTIIETAIDQF